MKGSGRTKRANIRTKILLFNRSKGFNTSCRKALVKAFEDEGNIIDPKDQRLAVFISYVTLRIYLRFYKWFVRNVYFRRGKTKFVLYSLRMFCPIDSRPVLEEIFNEVSKIA